MVDFEKTCFDYKTSEAEKARQAKYAAYQTMAIASEVKAAVAEARSKAAEARAFASEMELVFAQSKAADKTWSRIQEKYPELKA
jgi:hypothetical protein